MSERPRPLLRNPVPYALTYDDVLLRPRYSPVRSRADVDLTSGSLKLPVVAANMDTVCGVEMAIQMRELGGLGIIHRGMTPDTQAAMSDLFYRQCGSWPIHSIGSILTDPDRIKFLLREGVLTNSTDLDPMGAVCVDIAHGHSVHMKETVQYLRSEGFKGTIIGGNVATREATKDLYDWGADIVKAGVGPGSACSTRSQTGTGVPQLQAVIDCSNVVTSNRRREEWRSWTTVPIIADGGIRNPGDAAKALAAGATWVMIGGMLAGTDKVPGWHEGGTIEYRGMASKAAQVARGQKPANEEGVVRAVKCKPAGSTAQVLNGIAEGLRSALSYSGASDMETFQREAEFVVVSGATQHENVPHFRDT